MCLKCVVRLCEVTPDGADRFVDVIHSSFGFVPGQITFHFISQTYANMIKQECIPVGCVPTAAVAAGGLQAGGDTPSSK